MVRQRRLERCGWSFWRVGGGEFYRDSEAALQDLWRTLERHGIRPGSTDDDAPHPAGDSLAHGSVAPPAADPAAVSPEVGVMFPGESAPESSDDPARAVRPEPVVGPSALPNEPSSPSAQGPAFSRSAPARVGSWEEYEAAPSTQPLPSLADAPATLPLSNEEESEDIGHRPAVEEDVVPGWLSHGVLGTLAAGTVPELAAYRVAEPTVDTFGLHLSQVPRASLAEILRQGRRGREPCACWGRCHSRGQSSRPRQGPSFNREGVSRCG